MKIKTDYAPSIVTRPESILKREWYWLVSAGVIVAMILDWCAR